MIGKLCEKPYTGYVRYKTPPMKDGRERVYLVKGSKRKWLTLAKYKLEVSLGRRLLKEEEADHKDGNPTNDRLSNLQVLSKQQNRKKAIIDHGRTSKWRTLRCPICKVQFERRAYKVDFKIKQGKQPCCSRPCGYKQGNAER